MFQKNRFEHMLAGPLGYVLIIVAVVVFLSVVFVLISGARTVDVLSDIHERGTIVVGVLDNMPPYSQVDEYGQAVGFESELATMIGENVLGGPGVQFLTVNVKTARAYLDNGDCDLLIAMLAVNEDTENDYNLTDSYVQEDVQLLSKSGFMPDLRVSDTKIGVILGSDTENVLIAYLNSNNFDASVVEVPSYPDALEAVRDGSIHAFCATYSVLSKYDDTDIFINPIPVGHLNYAIAVRKEEVDLFDAVKIALDSARDDGRLNDLYTRYGLSAPTK